MPKFIDYKQLKERLEFPTVLSHYGEPFDPSRTSAMLRCCFHEDRNASLSVALDKPAFRCFGCDVSGNVLDFVTLREGHDPDDPEGLREGAVYAIEQVLGLSLSDFARKASRQSGRARSARNKKQADSFEDVGEGKGKDTQKVEPKPKEPNKPLGFALQNLGHEHALFDAHGLEHDAIELFGLGYCSRGSMKGRVVFPIHNPSAELVAYAGRWADDEPVPKGEGKYKLPGGFEKSLELYNVHRARDLALARPVPPAGRVCVLVEGYWSTIRLHDLGTPTVACFGSDLSAEQAALLAGLRDDEGPLFARFVVLFDGDEAGWSGAARAAGQLAPYGYVKAPRLEPGEKPDTLERDRLRTLIYGV